MSLDYYFVAYRNISNIDLLCLGCNDTDTAKVVTCPIKESVHKMAYMYLRFYCTNTILTTTHVM